MIPPTLAAFRALMVEGHGYAEDAHNEWCGPHYKSCDCHDIMSAFQSLATATPEQLLGIAFVIRDEYQQDTAAGPVSGYYVTPREDA